MNPREIIAALLLAHHCRIVCQPICINGRNCWRVDIPGCTTLLSGSTLVLMAERRLPAGLWQKLTKELV